MRRNLSHSLRALAFATLTTTLAPAADVFWTNTAGGNWSRAANWNPNVHPSAADNAFITVSGNYTVTQDVSAAVASLTLGDGISGPTLTNEGYTLTLSGPSLVRSQAVFGLGGGSLSGSGWLAIEGLGVWTAGQVANASAITVANTGVLEITGPDSKLLRGALTNSGWVRITGGGALGFCAGTVANLGVFELENDQPLYLGSYCGPSLFWNTGLLRKSGGTGTNLFWGVPVANTGSIEVLQGWISFNGNSSFGSGTIFLGAGTNLLDRGNIYFDGTIVSTNAELGGATLLGTSSLSGVIRWTAGAIDGSARVSVAADGELEITGPPMKLLSGVLTNLGLVRVTGPGALGFCAGTLQNAGAVELENDQPIYSGNYCGASWFWNTGLLRKSGGGGTNQFIGVSVANTGTIEVQQGWISFTTGSWFGNGTHFLGAGTNLLDQGNVTFDGTIVSTNAELAGAKLLGTNSIVGLMRWTGGTIDYSARMTITSDGQLEIGGAAAKALGGTLSNQGQVRLIGAAALSLCAGTVENLGLFDLQNDQPIYLGGYCGPALFWNTGLLRKSGGGGTNQFVGVPVVNTGSLEVQQGWISFRAGSWFGTGTRFLGVGTNLLDEGNVTLDGMIVSTNAELAGATLLGTNTLSGVARWTGGTIDHSAKMTIAADGLLEITGPAAKVLGGTLSNQGLVRLTGAAALSLCAGTVENQGVFDLQNDQPIWLGNYCGSSLFHNTGLLRKSDGLGTNLFWYVPVANTGSVQVRQGWVSFATGSWFGTGTRFQGAGTNLLDQGYVTFDGSIVSTNAELAGAILLGTNTLSGAMRWTGGSIDHSARLTIAADGQLEITGPAPKVLGGTLSNQGLVRLTGAAALSLCAGTVENLGVFDLQNDQPIWLGSYCGASEFRNSGFLRKSAGVGTNQFWAVPVASTGTVELSSGTVAFDAGFTQTAGRTRLVGGSLSSSHLLRFLGGILCGSGEIFGDLDNDCELNPGQSIGVLTIHGNYTHHGRANLELGGLVPGTSHDRLNVTGAALLSGALNVVLSSGYRPQAGDAFQVLTFRSRGGSGLRFNGLDLGGGKYLAPVYNATDLTLITTNGPTNLCQLLLVPCAENTYQLRFTCAPDEYYTFEASAHLTNDWVSLYTTNSSAGVIDFIDADAPNYPHRFYRAKPGE